MHTEQGDVSGGPNAEAPHDVIILGAGISGLVSASVLVEQKLKRLAVVDEFSQVGGNHIDCTYGNYTFDVGSLIFQDDSPLLRHFPELLSLYVPISPRSGKLNPQGQITKYPISLRDDVIAAGPVEWIRTALSIVKARLLHRRIRNAREFARFWIGGHFLQRSGLENYLERFFGIPAEQIDVDFAEKRMLWIKEHANAGALLRNFRRRTSAAPTNRQLARPREGYAHLYQVAVRRLEKSGVTFVLDAEMRSLKRVGQDFVLDLADRSLRSRRVVSTVPIDRARALCGMPGKTGLDTVTLISLFYSFAGTQGFDCCILYNFSFAGAWKRITVFSDFYGKVDGRAYFTVEVIASQVGNSVDAADRDFRAHVKANGLFRGELVLEGSRLVPSAYPIYSDMAAARAATAIAELGSFGIESFGRQGGFDYQPTARVSTLHAEAMLERARAGEPVPL